MRKFWSETKDATTALAVLQKKHINEGKVLQALVKNPTDYLGAISQIPRNTRNDFKKEFLEPYLVVANFYQ